MTGPNVYSSRGRGPSEGYVRLSDLVGYASGIMPSKVHASVSQLAILPVRLLRRGIAETRQEELCCACTGTRARPAELLLTGPAKDEIRLTWGSHCEEDGAVSYLPEAINVESVPL